MTGLCKDCFLKAHPEVKRKEWKEQPSAEQIVKSLEINPSLKKTPYDTYKEIKKEELNKLRGNSFNPDIAKAQEIKQNSITRSMVLKESRELAQFLIAQRPNTQLTVAEFLELQKEIANKYFEWME